MQQEIHEQKFNEEKQMNQTNTVLRHCDYRAIVFSMARTALQTEGGKKTLSGGDTTLVKK